MSALLPTIDKEKLYSLVDDGKGIIITPELDAWLTDVVDVLNYLLLKAKFKERETRDQLAKMIMEMQRQAP